MDSNGVLSHDRAGAEVVLGLSRGQEHHFSEFANAAPYRVVLDSTWDPGIVDDLRPVVVITLADGWYESDRCTDRAAALGIPTLMLMDGILEWRHQWEDPSMGNGCGIPYLLPVRCDRVACLGRQSVRLLEAWGKMHRCELVGAPRFDHLLMQPLRPAATAGRRSLLIATANRPAYTEAQWRRVAESLTDLGCALRRRPDWMPQWRVCRRLQSELSGLIGTPQAVVPPLRLALEQSHAVITTPSTLQLEAMLAGRPTAVLDYTNSPQYVQAAWTISAPDHLVPVLDDLALPSPARMLHQRVLLSDCLSCESPAAPRLAALVEAMAEAGAECRRLGVPLHIRWPILPRDVVGCEPVQNLRLAELFPGNDVLQCESRLRLQLSVLAARLEVAATRRTLRGTSLLRRAMCRLGGLRDDRGAAAR